MPLTRIQKLEKIKKIYNTDDLSPYYIQNFHDMYYKNHPHEIDADFERISNNPNYAYITEEALNGVTAIGYKPLVLRTYYPAVHPEYDSLKDKRFKYTGHSELIVPRTSGSPVIITSNMNTPGYNLVTNNCSDATRCALETVFGQQLNPQLFTTPGDVRDFAIEQGGTQKNTRQITIPMNKERYERLKTYINNKNP